MMRAASPPISGRGERHGKPLRLSRLALQPPVVLGDRDRGWPPAGGALTDNPITAALGVGTTRELSAASW